MSIGTLYGQADNPRYLKCLFAATLSDIKVNTVPGFMMKDRLEPEYLEKFPLGQIPGLELKDGKKLTESLAIAQYLAELKPNNLLLGQDSWERAEIKKFSLLFETQLGVASMDIVYPLVGLREYNEDVVDRGYTKLLSFFEYLDSIFRRSNQQYLCCNRLTLADIDLICNLLYCYVFILTEQLRDRFSCLTSYYLRLTELPEIKQHIRFMEERGFAKEKIEFLKDC